MIDANGGVGHHDEHEEHVAVGAGSEDKHRQEQVDGIEEGAQVVAHNLAHRAGLGGWINVDVALRYLGLHLSCGEPC